MTILNFIISDDIVKGISRLEEVSNGDNGKKARFSIYTDRYPIVIESKYIYDWYPEFAEEWSETWKLYSFEHSVAALVVAKILDDERALDELNIKNR